MKLLSYVRLVSCAAAIALMAPPSAQAALPIELEVAAEGDAPLGAMQDWNAVLVKMDLTRIRLRGAKGGDEPSLKAEGSGAGTRYRMVGMINRQQQLVLPGGKFKLSDSDKLKQFFQDVPKRQEGGGAEAPKAPFGLTAEQFAIVVAELAKKVDEPTQDGSPHELINVVTKEVRFPVAGDIAMKGALRDAAPFRSQMKGLSAGTTLAAMLRGAGLQFVPDTFGPAPITLRVSKINPKTESWPVGWKAQGNPKVLAPSVYEVRNIEVGNFTLAAALAALQPHLGIPIVIDQRALADKEIDMATVQVKYPRKKTTIRSAVDVVLGQAKLSGELRVDEAGTPFYWVTPFGKDVERATPLGGAAEGKSAERGASRDTASAGGVR